MQKEIEVKAKVADTAAVRAQLEALGCAFTEPVTQEDAIFVDFEGDFAEFRPETNFLRIRRAHGKILFTLKRSEVGGNELSSIEREFEVNDAQQLEDTLGFLGYHEVIRVKKSRTKTRHNDMEICLDEVEGLGSFIEVEKFSDGDGDAVQTELFAFLQTLGVSSEDRVLRGYDTLLYLKNEGRS